MTRATSAEGDIATPRPLDPARILAASRRRAKCRTYLRRWAASRHSPLARARAPLPALLLVRRRPLTVARLQDIHLRLAHLLSRHISPLRLRATRPALRRPRTRQPTTVQATRFPPKQSCTRPGPRTRLTPARTRAPTIPVAFHLQARLLLPIPHPRLLLLPLPFLPRTRRTHRLQRPTRPSQPRSWPCSNPNCSSSSRDTRLLPRRNPISLSSRRSRHTPRRHSTRIRRVGEGTILQRSRSGDTPRPNRSADTTHLPSRTATTGSRRIVATMRRPNRVVVAILERRGITLGKRTEGTILRTRGTLGASWRCLIVRRVRVVKVRQMHLNNLPSQRGELQPEGADLGVTVW